MSGGIGAHASWDMADVQVAEVDGQSITLPTITKAVEAVETSLVAGRGLTLFTLNLDHLVKLRRNARFRDVYERATHVAADGWPIVLLARRRMPSMCRATGADMVLPLSEMAARQGIPVYLFGSTEAVLALAAAELIRRYPRLDIRGRSAPPLGFDPLGTAGAAAAATIATSGARLCFVALGAPKQEMFADAALARCPETGFVCIGAALDFLAGTHRRAPVVLRRLGLEWAWRLLHEPRRLGPRYLDCALLFAALLADTWSRALSRSAS